MYISTNISDNHKQLIRYDIISITKFHPPTKPTLFQQKSFDPENQSNSTQSLQLVLRFLNIPTFQFPNRCPSVSVSHPVYPKRCPERKSGFVAWRVSFPETTEARRNARVYRKASLSTHDPHLAGIERGPRGLPLRLLLLTAYGVSARERT